MKYIHILTILLTCTLIVSSCSEKSVPVKNDEALKQESLGADIPKEVATEVFDKAPITTENVPELVEEEDCHGKRMVAGTLEEVEGSILKVGSTFVISTDNGNNRYNPCALPEKLKSEGMLVRFTGEVLEILPSERLIATPFRLKNIVERDR